MKKMLKKAIAIILVAAFVFAIPNSVVACAVSVGQKIHFTVSDTAESDRIAQMASPKDGGLCLAKDGATDYVLIYSKDAGERLTCAVNFFAETFEKMTGAKLPVYTDEAAPVAKEIVIGETNRGDIAPDKDAAGADGYRVVTVDEKLFLCGVNELGSMNAVYGFLEDELGCLWATEDEDYIPAQPTIYIAKYDTVEKPAMDWRNGYAYETSQPNWFEKLRLNGIGYYSGTDEVNQYSQWGTWCHSFQEFVPESEYFDEHPEYFAEVDGVRARSADGKSAQLCLSNPEVFEIVKTKLAKLIEEHPEQLYWDFSIMDNWNRCTCSECKKADTLAGSGMGTLLPFINKLAKAFPDKYISTLAYIYTVDPPINNIKAEPNVAIKLCAMPGDQASTYADGKTSGARDYKTQLLRWKKVTDNIIVWDYVVNFSHLLLPFPNFAVQQGNQKFYEENNVSGVFHQASREKGDEFANLRAYVLAKLMWEGSSMDVAEVVGRYLSIYYGPAAQYIADYMNRAADELYDSGEALGLYDSPYTHHKGYLSPENISYYMECFEKAEASVVDDAVYLDRVTEAKIPVLYAKINEASYDEEGRQKAADEFFVLCDRYGITEYAEVNSSIEDYKNGRMDEAVAQIHAEMEKDARNEKLLKGFLAGGLIGLAIAGIVIAAGK